MLPCSVSATTRASQVLQIRVLMEQTVGRHSHELNRSSYSNGIEIADLRSSHSGTGSFFERRKAGSNNFD